MALVAVGLDRDGRSFWTATLESGHLYRIDVASGRRLAAFTAAPYQLLADVAIVGEPAAALTGASGARLPRPPSCSCHGASKGRPSQRNHEPG